MTDARSASLTSRPRGRPKAGDIPEGSAPVAEGVGDMLTDAQIGVLRQRVCTLPCVEALPELQRERLVGGLAQAIPLCVAGRGAFRNDVARAKVRGMKPRFHRAHLLNDVARLWEALTGEAGTLWVKPRKGQEPLASPVVQITIATAQSMGDGLSIRGWRSQIPHAEEILRKPDPMPAGAERVISLKG